jgi:hypothetical protein
VNFNNFSGRANRGSPFFFIKFVYNKNRSLFYAVLNLSSLEPGFKKPDKILDNQKKHNTADNKVKYSPVLQQQKFRKSK